MSAHVGFLKSVETAKRRNSETANVAHSNRRPLLGALVLFCMAGWLPQVTYGISDLPTVESVYVFTPDNCSLYQSGGPSGVSNTYSFQGRYQFIADPYGHSAQFTEVDATIAGQGPLYTASLDELFNMTGLNGLVINDTTVDLTGKTSDGTDSDVFLELTFDGDSVRLTGEISPPSGSNAYHYDLSAVAERRYGGGTGESYNPYLIGTAEHMKSLGDNPDDWAGYFKLTATIDLAAYRGTNFSIIGYYKNESDKKPFTGVFNGNGRTVLHFTYASTGSDRIGLFGYIDGATAQIKDLGMVDPNINAGNASYVGSLVGQLAEGTLTNCYVQAGRVIGTNAVGGLVGGNGLCRPATNGQPDICKAGALTGCYSTTSVTGVTNVGTLVGWNNGAITDCNATGTVAGDHAVGGLAGANGGTMTNCWAAGTASGTKQIGGLVGHSLGVICGSHASTGVNGEENIGGLVGENDGGSITSCYSTGAVGGDSLIGGLAGLNGGNIYASYSAGTITGLQYTGGLVGENDWRISNCYSQATVTAQSGYAGGLVGINAAAGWIGDNYSSGHVTGGLYIGGLLGSNDGVVLRCYARGAVDGLGGLGGMIGDSTDEACALFSFWDTQTSGRATSAGGTGKTTAQLKTVATFGDWRARSDEGAWTINQGKDYPRLAWEGQPGVAIPTEELTDLLSGSGLENDPFLISTAEDLNTIGLFTSQWDKHFKLMANVDMSAYAATGFNMIGYYRIPFTGVFDGNGHTILNLTSSTATRPYLGLFGCIRSLDAKVKDLGLVDPNIDAAALDYVGPLAGCLKEGTVTNCYAESVDISGHTSVGGLVGHSEGTLENCHSTGAMAGSESVGGLVGSNWRGSIQDCNSTCTVAGDSYVGGLAGLNEGTITGGYAAGSVSASDSAGGLAGKNSGTIENAYSTGQTTGDTKVGGLVGNNQGNLTTCHATGNVNGDQSVGGLAGCNSNADIASCYTTGNVYGRLAAGGLIGLNGPATTVTSCYSTGTVSGYEWIGGLAGRNEGSIAKCRSSSTVSGTMEIGGLVGLNLGQGQIASCYASGTVSGNEWVGGLVGTNYSSITKCYSSGNVAGMQGAVGGLVALSYGTITGSFWDTQTSGQATSAGGTGKTTAQMKTRSTFIAAGWDFVGETANGTADIWRILDGQDYPRLTWETN